MVVVERSKESRRGLRESGTAELGGGIGECFRSRDKRKEGWRYGDRCHPLIRYLLRSFLLRFGEDGEATQVVLHDWTDQRTDAMLGMVPNFVIFESKSLDEPGMAMMEAGCIAS